MELRELSYFLAIYEERSVSAAARRSYVSQPSVSEALANLEHELATQLFVRHRKGATPTAAGEQLYPIAQRLVSEARGLPALFQAAPRPRRVVLGLMRSLDIARVRALISALTAHGAPRDALRALALAASDARDGAIDLQLVDADAASDLRRISRSMRRDGEVFTPLWDERYVAALPRDHALAGRKAVRLSELAGAKLIARCHCEQATRFVGPGQRFDIAAIAQTEEWALALVAAGLGIAIVPEGVAAPDAAIALVPLADVQAKRQVGLAYGGHGAPAPDLQRVIDRLIQRARELAPKPRKRRRKRA